MTFDEILSMSQKCTGASAALADVMRRMQANPCGWPSHDRAAIEALLAIHAQLIDLGSDFITELAGAMA